MKEIILKKAKLFENLIEFKIDDKYIDIHNCYYCHNVLQDVVREELKIIFFTSHIEDRFLKVEIKLTGVEIKKMSLPLQYNLNKKITLDTFYRGRFELENELYESSRTDKDYYYIGFYEDYNIETFANDIRVRFFEKK